MNHRHSRKLARPGTIARRLVVRNCVPWLLTGLCALALSCGGSSASGAKDGSPSETGTSDGSATGKSVNSDGSKATHAASGKSKELRFDKVSPRSVTTLRFVRGKLAIGFSDGALALVETSSGTVVHSKVAKIFAVAAVAPGGDLALLDANPPVIVNMKGDLILQMNTVPSFESAVFGNDGITLYVADKEGKVRIWGQPHSFEEDQHKEKLENYLNRQAPDFHVEFPQIRGPIHITGSNKLVIVDKDGAVRIWDPTRPSASKRIMKVGGGARSVASADGHVFVTSQSGALKVGLEDGSGFLPWSKDARAAFVEAGPMTAGTFFTQDNGKIASRNTQTGEEVWSTSTPDGHACGLALSDDGNTLAACIGNFIAVYDASTGAARAYGYRAEGDFQWKD